jgi:uncharacterized protein YqgQ
MKETLYKITKHYVNGKTFYSVSRVNKKGVIKYFGKRSQAENFINYLNSIEIEKCDIEVLDRRED